MRPSLLDALDQQRCTSLRSFMGELWGRNSVFRHPERWRFTMVNYDCRIHQEACHNNRSLLKDQWPTLTRDNGIIREGDLLSWQHSFSLFRICSFCVCVCVLQRLIVLFVVICWMDCIGSIQPQFLQFCLLLFVHVDAIEFVCWCKYAHIFSHIHTYSYHTS